MSGNLWEVNDEAAGELVERFYRKLFGNRNATPAGAMRSAQVALADGRRFRHPYYWSGYRLYGDYR